MGRRITILLSVLLSGCLGSIGINSFGQTASFTAPDTVCVNTPVTVTNTSTNATTYNWNFCMPDPAAQVSAVSFGNFSGKLVLPVTMDYVQVNGNYYGFVVNNTPGGLVRLDFGNSLMNTPTAVSLGDFGGKLAKSALGIQVVQNNDRWYAFITCGDDDPSLFVKTDPRLLMIDFGAAITNTSAVATDWKNVGGQLKYAHELFMFEEPDGNWYGFTVSYWNSCLTRFSFGKDFNIQPTAVNFTKTQLGVLNGPTGLSAVKSNGNWHLFVTNFNDHSLARIDFGNSLLNTPTAAASVNLGNPGSKLFKTRDIILFATCDEIAGYVANDDGNVIRLSFKNITDVPTASNAGKVADNIVSFSKTFRHDGELYSFIPSYIPAGLGRLKYPSCGSSTGSTQSTLPAISYAAPGTYYVSLRVDQDLPTETVFCKRIVAIAPPTPVATGGGTICPGDSVRLTATNGGNYQWLPNIGLSHANAASTMASPPVTTSYTVHATDRFGCSAQASVQVTVKQLPIFNVAASPESICPGDTVTFTASGGDTYEWTGLNGVNAPSVSIVPTNAGPYRVKVTESICKITGTISVSIDLKKAPAIHAGKTGDIDCSSGEVQLTASGGNDYQWSPVTGLSSATSANPTVRVTQNTTYTVTTTGLNGCKSTDTVTVMVLGAGSASSGYYMPNGFTPNGDGLNDCFGLAKWGAVSQLQFNIYDRWGSIIFSAKDASQCWDGTYKGIAQPPGTYIYNIRASTNCGEIERKGTVVLIR